MSLDDVSDPTPESVRGALDVVVRHGQYLSPEKFGELSPDDREAIEHCVNDFMPRLALQISEAQEAGDKVAVWILWCEVCGWINRFFDQVTCWDLQALPAEEREVVRAQPVNQETWRQLRARSRWHMAHPGRHSHRCPGAARRYGRHGRQTRHARRRRVASSPRRARAPSRQGEDPEPDPELAALTGVRSRVDFIRAQGPTALAQAFRRAREVAS
jgi:hypothetical protein